MQLFFFVKLATTLVFLVIKFLSHFIGMLWYAHVCACHTTRNEKKSKKVLALIGSYPI